MTTDQQVRRLMLLIKKGLPLSTAAVKAGMSEPTARKYRRAGKLPSELKASHAWRTRPDPFAEVWPEIEALLEREGGLEAKTVFEELRRRYPGRFRKGQLRTLQRRFRGWRALSGSGAGGLLRAGASSGRAVPVGLHGHGGAFCAHCR